AESRVGCIVREDLRAYRDELIISTKAGYLMWPGPYGEWGSRKSMLASLDQSLKRLGLDYVDIFYSHRPDPDTPLEETLGALDHAVRSGKALYAGISSYNHEMTRDVMRICRDERLVQPVIHQPSYNMFNRWVEDGLTTDCEAEGLGMIAFCPLAQGILTSKYLSSVPVDSRAASGSGFLSADAITQEKQAILKRLNELARERNQSLAQMSLAWVLRLPQVTSALIGASRAGQIRENVAALDNLAFSTEELDAIDELLAPRCAP
ncbi:MAG: aldo/keto reductase, partial [Verrucomicrobia bacterium]|nr:aldo/keto reductase [Verrucomicrobiota bacterium]